METKAGAASGRDGDPWSFFSPAEQRVLAAADEESPLVEVLESFTFSEKWGTRVVFEGLTSDAAQACVTDLRAKGLIEVFRESGGDFVTDAEIGCCLEVGEGEALWIRLSEAGVEIYYYGSSG